MNQKLLYQTSSLNQFPISEKNRGYQKNSNHNKMSYPNPYPDFHYLYPNRQRQSQTKSLYPFNVEGKYSNKTYQAERDIEIDKSQSQRQEIQKLALQVQTLQKHIFKLQNKNQMQHRLFKDEVQKLKLYIEQCEHQIRKRQQRQLALIETLKQLEEQIIHVKSEHKESLQNQMQNFDKSRIEQQIQFNSQRQSLIAQNQQYHQMNQLLKKQLNEAIQSIKENKANHIRTVQEYKQQFQSQIAALENQLNNYAKQSKSSKKKCAKCLQLEKSNQAQRYANQQIISGLQTDIQSLLDFFSHPSLKSDGDC